MLDLSELYLLLIRLQSITKEFTHVTWGHASDMKVYVLLLLICTFVWLFCNVVVVAGILIVPSELMEICPEVLLTMPLENPKYLCKPAPKLITGVYVLLSFSKVQEAPEG